MLSPSPCSLLPAPMQPQPEILAYWTGSLPPHLSFLKMKQPCLTGGEGKRQKPPFRTDLIFINFES
jgi:hypothetical protein